MREEEDDDEMGMSMGLLLLIPEEEEEEAPLLLRMEEKLRDRALFLPWCIQTVSLLSAWEDKKRGRDSGDMKAEVVMYARCWDCLTVLLLLIEALPMWPTERVPLESFTRRREVSILTTSLYDSPNEWYEWRARVWKGLHTIFSIFMKEYRGGREWILRGDNYKQLEGEAGGMLRTLQRHGRRDPHGL
jgi:hypothetical protein